MGFLQDSNDQCSIGLAQLACLVIQQLHHLRFGFRGARQGLGFILPFLFFESFLGDVCPFIDPGGAVEPVWGPVLVGVSEHFERTRSYLGPNISLSRGLDSSIDSFAIRAGVRAPNRGKELLVWAVGVAILGTTVAVLVISGFVMVVLVVPGLAGVSVIHCLSCTVSRRISLRVPSMANEIGGVEGSAGNIASDGRGTKSYGRSTKARFDGINLKRKIRKGLY
jgi:hypothetical protein